MSGKPVGYQRWQDLLSIHWPIAVASVRALVPRQLEQARRGGRRGGQGSMDQGRRTHQPRSSSRQCGKPSCWL